MPTENKDSTSETDHSIDSSVIDNAQEQQILHNINRLDGFFTENHGQVRNDSVRYYVQGKGVWFLDDGVVFEIRDAQKVEGRESCSREPENLFYTKYQEFENPMPIESVILKLNFEGANKVTPEGRGLLSHKSNFFYGNESSKWCSNVPNFQEVIYQNLYDNIDLRYFNSNIGLKYDFIIHPGGDPNDIRMKYVGAQKLFIDSNNNLNIQTELGNIIDSELFIYQETLDIENNIEGNFKIIDSMSFGFEITSNFDVNKPLIIDPLLYSTFIGGSNDEYGYDIGIDSNGYIYVTGSTESTNFPNTTGANDTTHNGGVDVFVLKLNSIGSSLLYSTFIG
ncbi:MAG: SBBP repeat-containing protein, partial [Thermoplasmata archaeon]|nr:SBBP repeat-containing protein [Thermoplasmata archaeon]